MTTFVREFILAAKESPRLYLAVLIGAVSGAVRGAIEEWDRVIAESRNPKTANSSNNINSGAEQG